MPEVHSAPSPVKDKTIDMTSKNFCTTDLKPVEWGSHVQCRLDHKTCRLGPSALKWKVLKLTSYHATKPCLINLSAGSLWSTELHSFSRHHSSIPHHVCAYSHRHTLLNSPTAWLKQSSVPTHSSTKTLSGQGAVLSSCSWEHQRFNCGWVFISLLLHLSVHKSGGQQKDTNLPVTEDLVTLWPLLKGWPQ